MELHISAVPSLCQKIKKNYECQSLVCWQSHRLSVRETLSPKPNFVSPPSSQTSTSVSLRPAPTEPRAWTRSTATGASARWDERELDVRSVSLRFNFLNHQRFFSFSPGL